MRWVAFGANEYAFLSVGMAARGVIAIGGMAHGVIAIGAFVSVGVVSVGMNAVGSVAAFGMNAVAPISISLINALGIYVLAGTNGCGTWTRAGVNATGLTASGGVNNDKSLFPTVMVLVALIVGSTLFRGARVSRRRGFVRLGKLWKSSQGRAPVRARLVAIGVDSLDLADDDETLSVACDDPTAIADAKRIRGESESVNVIAMLEWVEKTALCTREVDYRSRPLEKTERVLSCTAVMPDVEPNGFLPENTEEVQWVIAWSARIAALVALVAIWKWW